MTHLEKAALATERLDKKTTAKRIKEITKLLRPDSCCSTCMTKLDPENIPGYKTLEDHWSIGVKYYQCEVCLETG